MKEGENALHALARYFEVKAPTETETAKTAFVFMKENAQTKPVEETTAPTGSTE